MIAESRRNAFWFGTEEKMGWFPTPNRGAQTGGSGWSAEGTTLNGGGFQLNSFGSHRQYIFEWPNTSSAKMAQTMKSYADGSFGRGLLYFIDPLIYTTNVLPAMWADPSMGIGQEGASLVYGVEASGLPTSDNPNDLPVKSAYYDLGSIAAGWRGKEDAVFIPVPEGYTFSFGSIHSQTGQGRVLYRTQSRTGALGAVTAVTPLLENTSQLVNTFISGPDLAGVWLFVGKIGAGAGSVTLTAMTGRLLPTVKSIIAPVATNLFTNPRLVGADKTEVGRNLFTNPRLVGDGTWAEVWGNLCENPGFEIDTSKWSNFGAVTRTRDTSVSRSGAASMRVTGGTAIVGTYYSLPVAPGEHVGFIAHVESLSHGLTARIDWHNSGGSNISWSTMQPVAAGTEWQEVRYEPVVAPANTATARITIYGTTPSMVFHVDDVMIVKSPVLPRYFDGSTPDFTVDPDMRQRWLGAPNASESVMEGERVAGLAAANCVGIVSTRDGKPAVRLIPTGTSTTTYVRMSIPVEARASGTLLGTLHQLAPLTGPTSAARGYLYANAPQQSAGISPNEGGSFPKRVAFSNLTADFQVYLWHGGAQGSGDVWWTDIALFAGDYRYPWNGSPDDLSGITQPEDFQTRWAGAEDNSELVLEIERVRGVTAYNCAAGVSTKDGRPAVRLIPTSSDPNSFAQISPHESAGTVRTLVGTAHLISPLTGTLGPFPSLLRFSGQASPPAIPNEAGSYPQRITHTYTGVGTFATIRHGGPSGSGDVWWTDIGLFAGDYDGPAFSGSSGIISIGSQLATTEWDGTIDNSTSTAYSTSTELINIRKGPWMGGQGHSGCRFIGKPTEIKYGPFNGGQVGFAASFREVGSWLYG